MGMIAELVRVVSSSLKTRTGAPGRQVVITGKGIGATDSEAEVYPSPGIFARPPRGSRVVVVPLAGGRTRVVIGAANYGITLDCAEGETILYSTDAAGTTLKAQVHLDASGLIKIANSSKSLKTVLDSILSHLSTLTTTGTAAAQTISGASKALLEADKADLALLLKS